MWNQNRRCAVALCFDFDDDFRPYWVVDRGKQTEIVEVPVSWELENAAHFLFTFSPVYYTGMAAG